MIRKRDFLETLFEKARRWASTIEIDKLDGYKFEDKYTKTQKKKSFKWQFLKRFAKEGITVHVAFEAWRNLKLDPVKDDMKEFMTNVKHLATTLKFNQEEQIMAIKSNMPRDVYGLCMQYNELDKLKKFLIELFENPRMKSEVPSLAPAAETSAFSMGDCVNNDVVSATSDDMGKLKHEISSLWYKVKRMTSADSRSKPNSKPWKPEVTPPRRRGGSFRGKGGKQNESGRQASTNNSTNGNSGSGRNFNSRNQSRNSGSNGKSFGNKGQNNGNFGGNQRNRGRGRGRFDTSPNVRRPRVASKTIDEDKGRCFYCNEYGHFIRECPKKIDYKKSMRFSRMDTQYKQDGQYSDYASIHSPPESLPRFILDRDKLCLTKEQAEHFYDAVVNDKQVYPLAVNSRVDDLSKVVNPYTVGLRTDTDSTLKKEPSSEVKKCDLTWSILSTVVDYTKNDKDSPNKEVNHSPIYSRFESAQDLIID